MSSVETPGYRGLSPLARGTRRINSQVQRPARFIPAGAGNTLSVTHSSNYQPVYPRWRGEHPMGIRYDNTVYGLSPLARGTRGNGNRPRGRGRFIPAGAGNTATRCSNEPFDPVYPRWRGEHAQNDRRSEDSGGLSPLARGTRRPDQVMVLPLRFIPAGAGNTDIPPDPRPKSAVYPRWRGEHNGTDSTNQNFRGLSPLARGTHYIEQPLTVERRFIPAGAGNTDILAEYFNELAVYPRWRGEHSDRRGTSALLNGLSPLARGTLVVQPDLEHSVRFIPAGAGNTGVVIFRTALNAVYPRWRGEHKTRRSISLSLNGLSPLARGTLD